MKKVSLNIKTIIIFVCVLLKYLIEYGVNTYILYSAVIAILFFEFLTVVSDSSFLFDFFTFLFDFFTFLFVFDLLFFVNLVFVSLLVFLFELLLFLLFFTES